MLSRIAESLFWLGRYLERAEDTARLLDAHLSHLLEVTATDEMTMCSSLLEVMECEIPAHGQVDAAFVTRSLAFDAENPNSIVGSLRAARAAARGAREAISSEMWECLNGTYNELPDQERSSGVFGPSLFFRWVRNQTAVMAGLTESTMSRDDGYRFLVLGRSLERVDMTARMLMLRYSSGATSADWVTTLRCCSAHEAYLRTYRRAVDGSLVLEFLLLDRLFPRSVFHSLSLAERMLAELDPHPDRSGISDAGRRLIGRARTELEFRQIEEILDDLAEHLEAVETITSEVSNAVGDRFFRHQTHAPWQADSERLLPAGVL